MATEFSIASSCNEHESLREQTIIGSEHCLELDNKLTGTSHKEAEGEGIDEDEEERKTIKFRRNSGDHHR